MMSKIVVVMVGHSPIGAVGVSETVRSSAVMVRIANGRASPDWLATRYHRYYTEAIPLSHGYRHPAGTVLAGRSLR
jgi:hypothetical protein